MQEPSLTDLESCLAWVILQDAEDWLGAPSPRALETVLLGASARAQLVQPDLHRWKIFGPLNDREFYRPIVARTGHPTLSIRWASALEFLYFSMAEAMAELRRLIRGWVEAHGLREEKRVGSPFREHRISGPDTDEYWRRMAKRPGMFLGDSTGEALHHYLIGMTRGGDWLGLAEVPRARQIVDNIEGRSQAAYGSPFAGYRVYGEEGVQELLSWAGIEA